MLLQQLQDTLCQAWHIAVYCLDPAVSISSLAHRPHLLEQPIASCEMPKLLYLRLLPGGNSRRAASNCSLVFSRCKSSIRRSQYCNAGGRWFYLQRQARAVAAVRSK
jgi:hypothetical protein